jgi:hypothetical protein
MPHIGLRKDRTGITAALPFVLVGVSVPVGQPGGPSPNLYKAIVEVSAKRGLSENTAFRITPQGLTLKVSSCRPLLRRLRFTSLDRVVSS